VDHAADLIGELSARRSAARAARTARSLLVAIVVGAGLLPAGGRADINPWIAAQTYDAQKWDTAGPQAATPWLHPNVRIPNQGWGILDGPEVFSSGEWRQLGAATGSWGTFGDMLQRRGISIGAAYFGQLAANPAGGERQGTTYKNDISLALFLDLQRLIGLYRGYFAASFDYKTPADSLTTDYIGNQFPVQLGSFDDQGATRLVLLAYGQQLFDNTTEVVGGRLITGEDFASLRLACTSLNQAICGNPINAAQNISWPTYPNAVWGGRLKFEPRASWYVQAGSYLVYEQFADADLHGVKFSAPPGSGALSVAEAGYRIGSLGAGTGLPGIVKLGGYYDSQQLQDLESERDVWGTWGLYALGQQMLFSEGASQTQGLSAFWALSYAPPDRNRLELMAAGGLSYAGLVPHRDQDALAFVFAYGQYSADLRRGERARGEAAQDYEVLLELNYRITLAPWLFVQPDIQGIIQPSGYSGIPDALVIGFATGVVF